MKIPARSLLDQTSGLIYFARMLDKIRRHARGELRDDLHANLGRGADQWCCGFLHLAYEDVKARVLAGGTDEEILEWCQTHGRRLNETDLLVWNAFVTKLGWNDFASKRLAELKTASGFAHRDDLVTMPQYIDADEGRG